MTKYRTAMILQGLILMGLLLAAVISAPTRAATIEPNPQGYQAQLDRLQDDYVRVTAASRR